MLRDKIANRDAVVGVVGMGYVGLPLVLTFGKVGFPVIGFDIDMRKVVKLNEGQSYIKHIPSTDVAELSSSGRFSATSDFSRMKTADALLVCVPTPLTLYREPDMSFVEATVKDIARFLRPGQLVVLESTTYPGTTEEVVLPLLEATGLKVGKDFYLAFSPEREDPGNPNFVTKTIPKVVGGVTKDCLDNACALYGAVIERVVPVSSSKVAELTKLLENVYRGVNIALVNELKVLCHRMGVDVNEVIDAAATKPFGFHPFYPGPGLGGHCIPVDPFYLTWKAREYDVPTRFIELAGEVNTSMPYYVVERTKNALNQHERSLKGSRILVMGLAYKRDVDDMRESPSLKIISLLLESGAKVDYNDPFIPKMPKLRKYDLEMSSVEVTEEALASYDLVLLVTDHSAYDYQWIVDHSKLVVDTRNATKGVVSHKERVHHA